MVSSSDSDTSKDTVAEVTANGPFFATVGFSQGANVAAALLAKQART